MNKEVVRRDPKARSRRSGREQIQERSNVILRLFDAIPDSVLVVGFCALIALQILWSLSDKSLTFDESNRFLSGYQYVAHGDFRLGPDHPPLVKYLVGLPLFFSGVTLPPEMAAWNEYQNWCLGHDFLYKYNDAETLIWMGRVAVLPLTILLAIFVFLWGRDLFGRGAGVFALFLLSFEPNVLAHGGLVNTDLGLACFVFLTMFGFYRLSQKITPMWVVFTGLSFGLALSTKFTSLWLVPILLTLGLVRALSPEGITLEIPGRGVHLATSLRARLGAIGAILAVIGLAGYLSLWGVYQFRYSVVAPAGDPALTSYFDEIIPEKAPLKQAFSFMREYHLLPEAYLFGVARVLDLKVRRSYLMGETGTGWWYYFFVTFLIKTPIPLIILVLLGLICVSQHPQSIRAGPLYLFVPIVVYFGIATLSHLNLGHRHILAIYPFLFVLASAVSPWIQEGRMWKGSITVLCAWYAVVSLNIFPHYLAYFNELVGGPDKGHEYLVDSNLDWGQDLKGLKKFMDQNGIDRVWLSYFGTASPDYYGIDYNYLPGGVGAVGMDVRRLSGPARYVAVSATNLQGVYYSLDWGLVRDKEPLAKIGYSIFVWEFDRPLRIFIPDYARSRQLCSSDPPRSSGPGQEPF